jgi:hypothetical protein
VWSGSQGLCGVETECWEQRDGAGVRCIVVGRGPVRVVGPRMRLGCGPQRPPHTKLMGAYVNMSK